MSLWLASCLTTLMLLHPSLALAMDRTEHLKNYMQAASESLGPEQLNALNNIKDDDRRYLAMTYYLRAGKSIASRWSWHEEQIKAYERSQEFQEALVEIKKIAECFSTTNPNYVLYTNTSIRSLEEQLRRWQTVRSIGVAAKQLREVALAELERNSYPLTSSHASLKKFQQFLRTWRASPPPTLAAPGLSLHGRGRAFDFQIRDIKGRDVANTDTSTIRKIWDGQGWTEKLSQAVHGTSDKFIGPLMTPREPWHYEYRPTDVKLAPH